jgi:hypothetical protein
MSLTLIHESLARAVLIFSVILAIWSLARALRRLGIDGTTWGIYACGEILFLGQGTVGVLQLLAGARPERGIHILYGAVAVLTLPAAYALSRGRGDRRAAWMYTLLGLFLVGIALRARGTG